MAYEKVITENRKAHHDFEIEETFEAGIELKGSEVKSVKVGKVSISEAFVHPKDGELYIYNMHIAPYSKSSIFTTRSEETQKVAPTQARNRQDNR